MSLVSGIYVQRNDIGAHLIFQKGNPNFYLLLSATAEEGDTFCGPVAKNQAI